MTTENDHLRDLLQRTAPDRPELEPGARAVAVARRGRAARLRDRGLVAGAAVAVLAAAIAVPLSLGGDDAPDVATQPPAPTAPPCPTGTIEVGPLPSLPSLDDVVSVRSCPAAWSGAGPAAQTDPLPTAPLVGDAAAAFAEDVAALPAYAVSDQCALISVMPDPWALVVTTSDGDTAVLGSTMRFCSAVTVGGTERGAGDVIAAFEGNLERQRAGIPDLSCPTSDRLAEGAPTWNASFDPSTATAGVACYRVDPNGRPEYAGTAGELSADQLAVVRDDLAANLGPSTENGMCVDSGPQRLVILEDAEGDQAAYVDEACTGEFVGARGYWVPGSAAADAIADALGGRVGR
jgi:hypothetical protein